MKAISTIIATIILVVIAISLVGTAYLFVSGLLTGQTSKNIKLMEASGHIVIIQNMGTQNITSNDIRVLVNGESRDTINPQTIKPGDAVALKFIPPNFGNEVISANVIVVGPSNSLNYRIDFIPHEHRVTSETVGLWHFNENTGTTATDSSSNHNYGTLMNGPNWVDGKFGRGLQFDGFDDYVDIPDISFSVPDEITISAWIYPLEFKDWPGIVKFQGWGDRIWFGETSSGTWTLGYNINTAGWSFVQASLGPTNTWYHVVGTIKGKNMTLYVNGGLKTSGEHAYVFNWGDINANIWVGTDGGSHFFNGMIDEVVIYNRALSQEEILDSIYG